VERLDLNQYYWHRGKNILMKEKYGYIDRTGQYIIPPQFDGANNFSEGLAAVWIYGKWGYIDRTGEYTIAPQFDWAGNFSEGLVSATIDNIKYEYIDPSGQNIICPQFNYANNFSEGLAAVRIEDGWGYIDTTGQYIISPQFDCWVENFSEGLAAVRVERDWGYIDTTGQYIISPRFERANSFSEGLAAVVIDEKWGYIEATGEYIISPQFDWGDNFSEGLAAICIDGKWGYINPTGEYVIAPQFDWANNFSEGLAAVCIDEKWGYINPTGAYIISSHFDEAENFSEGLAAVCIDGKWGYIEPTGEYIISPQFDGIENFSAGLALVKIKVKYEWNLDPIDYHTDKHPRFGKSNPEAMDVPFWREMVRLGWGAYSARRQYQDTDYDWESRKPVWCFSRFGQSITLLPDGRVIVIAGEHEDYYDPDFYIYNDIVVYDRQGDFQIYGYPKDVFPPTDFHTATLVDDWIYIIGNIGYQDERIVGKTPVYRLNCTSYAIEKIITTGECPSWIGRHQAILRDRQIHISGGKINVMQQDKLTYIENQSEYILDLNQHCWYRSSI
jgi:hypothetical protein